MATIKGTSGSDDLFGTRWTDKITGGSGHDSIEGGTGSDRLIGDSGDDFILGHGYDQSLTVHANDPPLWGIIKTRDDNDFLGGGSGNDRIVDWWGNNRADGGDGFDSIDLGSGDDLVIGGRGDDFLSGGPGQDVYYPGMGNDHIDDMNYGWDQEGNINYFGEPNVPDADLFIIERNLGVSGHDTIDGFDGNRFDGMPYDMIHFEGYSPFEVGVSSNGEGTETLFSFVDGSTLLVLSETPLGGAWDFV